jgi:hypothetical protein
MAIGLRVEEKLDGAANFGSLKERMILLLQENVLWKIPQHILWWYLLMVLFL